MNPCCRSDAARSPTTSRTGETPGWERRRSSAQGHITENRPGEAAVKWGVRPAYRSTTGRCGESNAALRGHRRPACVETATQPRDGCVAGMRDGRGAGRTPTRACTVLDTVVSEGPKRETLQPLRMCPPGRTIGRARLNPSGLTPGRLFGERGSILCSLSRIRGTGTLQVSRHETLEKPETASIINRTCARMEGFRGGFGPARPKSHAAT